MRYMFALFLLLSATVLNAQDQELILNNEFDSYGCGINEVKIDDWNTEGLVSYSGFCEGEEAMLMFDTWGTIATQLDQELILGREYVLIVNGESLNNLNVWLQDSDSTRTYFEWNREQRASNDKVELRFVAKSEAVSLQLSALESVVSVTKVSLSPGDPDDPDAVSRNAYPEFNVYPNPCQEILMVPDDWRSVKVIEVTTGQTIYLEVLNGTLSSEEIPFSSFKIIDLATSRTSSVIFKK